MFLIKQMPLAATRQFKAKLAIYLKFYPILLQRLVMSEKCEKPLGKLTMPSLVTLSPSKLTLNIPLNVSGKE